MDCITKTVFPDGRIRVSDGAIVRTLRLDELLNADNPWGLRVEVCKFETTEEEAFHDSNSNTYGLYADPAWWELIVSKEELMQCPDIYWFGEKVITFVKGEMVVLPLLSRAGEAFSGTQAEGLLECIGAISQASRRSCLSSWDDDPDEEDIDEKTARELGITVRLLKAGEDYYRQLQEERVHLFEPQPQEERERFLEPADDHEEHEED